MTEEVILLISPDDFLNRKCDFFDMGYRIQTKTFHAPNDMVHFVHHTVRYRTT